MKLKIRIERGKSWINFLKDLALIAVALKIFNIELEMALFLIPLAAVIIYFIGYLDEKKLIWKLEAEYMTREVNPYFKKLEETINSKKEG